MFGILFFMSVICEYNIYNLEPKEASLLLMHLCISEMNLSWFIGLYRYTNYKFYIILLMVQIKNVSVVIFTVIFNSVSINIMELVFPDTVQYNI